MGEIANKVQESRLKWYGHVLRREEEYVGRSENDGGAGERRRGIPKQRCLDNIKNDLSGRIVRGGSTIQSSMEASHKKHRPHINVGKDTEEDRPIVMELCIKSISFKFYNGNSILDNGVSKYEPVCTLLGIPSCKYINVIIVTWYICNHLAFLLKNVSFQNLNI